MAGVFKPSRTFLLRLPSQILFNRFMDRLAEQGEEYAKSHVRVDTGTLKDSVHIEKGPGGVRSVVAGTDHWLSEEYGGSGSNTGQPFLRPIIGFLGLRPKR